MDSDVKHALLGLISDGRGLIKTARFAVDTVREAALKNLLTPYGEVRADALVDAWTDAAKAVQARAEKGP